MKQLAIPLGRQKTAAKWLVISQTRREQKIATTHMFDMLEVIFCEQRNMATEVGFLDVPYSLNRAA